MKYIIAILAAMFLTACAGHGDYVQNEQPAYWMKEYPGADNAKVQRCLAVAEQAKNEAQVNSYGVMGFTVLVKGNAWEKCMEGK